MNQELRENDVPILAENLGVYVHFTKTTANKQDKVRIRCELYRYSDGKDAEPLETCSFLCDKEVDYRREVQRHAPGKFRAKLRSRAKTDLKKKTLYEELFREDNPFASFYKMHYENIVQLHGWARSTVKQYAQTLNLLIPWVPYKPVADLTAADFEAVIEAQCAAYLKEEGEPYSESRIGQFVDVLFALMDYAQAELMLPENVIKNTSFYDSSIARTTMQPLDTLIEKRLRSKGLEVTEQVRVAEMITEEIRSGTAPLAIGTAIQMLTGLRPSEVCALQKRSIMYFTTPGWEDRRYLLVCNKIDGHTGEPSYAMKTLYSYRAVPITKTLDYWLDLHDRTQGGETDAEEDSYLVTSHKNRCVPIKSQILCNYSAKILKRSVSNTEFATLQIPVQLDENGEWVAQEKNKNAYQFRRNYASMLLNILGMELCPDVQSLFGHKLLNQDLRRWLFNHEADLIRKMEELDKLIFLPERDSFDTAEPWHQKDPREEVHQLEGHGAFWDIPALKLAVQPYSDDDCVTVRLLLKAKEPGDAIRAQIGSESPMEVEADSFLAESTYRGEVNLQNAYLDEVFGGPAEAERLVPGPDERSDKDVEDEAEDESIEDDPGIKLGEEIDEIYDADEEFEGDEESDDDEAI